MTADSTKPNEDGATLTAPSVASRNEVAAPAPPPGPAEATAVPLLAPPVPLLPPVGAAPVAFGRYELLGEVARGGMGVVYRARQQGLDRVVALKMVLGVGAACDLTGQRFLQEARTAAALDHPNVVPVYDSGEINGRLYFTMALIDGPNLRSFVDSRGIPPVQETFSLFAQVVAGVAHAHRHGIIHRDLKPANVLIDRDGRPRVTDFGLAKRSVGSMELTATGQVVGTPAYMAPEQARDSKEVGPPADVYALGAILYFLLTGRAPFDGEGVTDLLIKVVTEAPTPPRALNPDVPTDLEALCLRCLSKPPGERYPDAMTLAEALVPLVDKYLPQSSSNLTPFGVRFPMSMTPTHPPALHREAPTVPAADAPAADAARRDYRPWLVALVVGGVLAGGLAAFFVSRGKPTTDHARPADTPTAPAADVGARPAAGADIPAPARKDFDLKLSLTAPAARQAANGTVLLTAGTPMRIHVAAAKDCQVGVWWIDPAGNWLKIFPNDDDTDDRLTAGVERVVPGNNAYVLDATPTDGTGVERLRVVATTGTKPAFPTGVKQGRYTAYQSEQDRQQVAATFRGIAIKKTAPASTTAELISEVELLFRVQR